MSNSRIRRRNRTIYDLGIKNNGSVLDLIDNAIKEAYRVTDDEFDYLIENLSDDEMNLFVKNRLTFGQKKQCLLIVSKHLYNYDRNKI